MLKNICCDISHEHPDFAKYIKSDELFFLVPSFFDIQVNGYNKITLDDGVTQEKLEQIAESLLADGVSNFIPTLITGEPELMINSLKEVRNFMRLYPGTIPGLHLEGPFISAKKKGIHRESYIREFTVNDLKTILEYKDAIAYITIDSKAIDDVSISILSSSGVKLSLGHTNANFIEGKRALAQGVSMGTHLFNAMSQAQNAREPMAAEAILEDPYAYASVIVDGIHVAYPLVSLAWKLLKKRFILTTDCLAAAGVKRTGEFISFKFSGTTIYNDPIHGCTDENGTLGGSRLTMLDGVRNLINHCNLTIEDAIYAASVAPAKAFNLELAKDYLVLNEDIKLQEVISLF